MIRKYIRHLLSDLAAQVRDVWEAPTEVVRLRFRVARLEGTVEALQCAGRFQRCAHDHIPPDGPFA